MTEHLRAFAPAKINLSLHVTGQRKDGYHLLQSLVVFADQGDWLTLRPGPMALEMHGPYGAEVPAGDDNLVLRAARLVGQEATITLEKHLPPASGIGGGSSDAAATLRGLAALAAIPLPHDTAMTLGADVPVCLLAQPAIMSGIGEVLAPVDWPDMAAVLVNPGSALSTAAVFSALPEKSNPPMEIRAHDEPPLDWLARQRNDLEPPAMGLAPEIAELLAALRSEGAVLARMSGSGATCFGLFDDRAAADRAALRLSGAHPRWWVQSCTLGTPPALVTRIAAG